MKTRRVLLLGLLPALAVGLSRAPAQEPPPIDPNKVSAYANKTFDFKTIDAGKSASDFSRTAPGFDKQYPMGASDWTDKKAELGGRDIYAPTLDFSKVYPTSDSSLFQGISPLSGQTSSLAAKTSAFSAAPPAPGFDHILDERLYQGREASIIREAMDRLDKRSHDALVQQTSGKKDAGLPSDPGWKRQDGPREVKPLISVDDVKLLVDKDITAASLSPAANSAPAQAPSAPAPVPAPPQIKAAP